MDLKTTKNFVKIFVKIPSNFTQISSFLCPAVFFLQFFMFIFFCNRHPHTLHTFALSPHTSTIIFYIHKFVLSSVAFYFQYKTVARFFYYDTHTEREKGSF